MPLSIFSSRRGGPAPRWLRDSIAGTLLAFVLLSVAEAGLRVRGFAPSARDDRQSWAYARSQVYGDHPQDVIALVGTSRIRYGIDTDLLREEFPNVKVVQLAIDGTAPFGVLRDLAADPKFTGLVIYDFLEDMEIPGNQEAAKPWIDHYYNRTVSDRIEAWFRTSYDARFAILSPQFDPRSFLTGLWRQRAFPKPYVRRYRADRSGIAQTEGPADPRIPKGVLREKKHEGELRRGLDAVGGLEGWHRSQAKVDEEIAQLRSRGGNVVLLRMPTGENLQTLDETYYPKRDYWDRRTQSATAIHFTELDSEPFHSFDGSHLSYSEARRFTRAFAARLHQLGILKAH